MHVYAAKHVQHGCMCLHALCLCASMYMSADTHRLTWSCLSNPDPKVKTLQQPRINHELVASVSIDPFLRSFCSALWTGASGLNFQEVPVGHTRVPNCLSPQNDSPRVVRSTLDLQVVDASKCMATKRKQYKHKRDRQHEQVKCQNDDLDPEAHSYCEGSNYANVEDVHICLSVIDFSSPKIFNVAIPKALVSEPTAESPPTSGSEGRASGPQVWP